MLNMLGMVSENWTIKSRDTRRIIAVVMKCMRITARQTGTDYKTNTEMAKEIHITQVFDKTQEETGYNIKTECLVIDC